MMSPHAPYHNDTVAHIEALEVTVQALERSVDFYQRALGLTLHQQSLQHATLGSAHHPFLRLVQDSVGRSTHDTAGLYHFALLLPSEKALAQVFRQLLQSDIRLSGASNHVISHALYLNDPDGHGIELAFDTEPSTWPWRAGRLDVFSQNGPLDLNALYALSHAEAYPSIHPDTRLGHVHLHTDNVDKSRFFYTDLLGMDVTIDVPGSALFLSHAHYHHHVALNQWRTSSAHTPTFDHSLRRLDYRLSEASYQALRERIHHHDYPHLTRGETLELRDPNGFLFHILKA